MKNIANFDTLRKATPKKVESGMIFSGYNSNGTATNTYFKIYVYSGDVKISETTEEKWTAGSASGNTITLKVEGENAVFETCQYHGGKSYTEETYIIGNGGANWIATKNHLGTIIK